MATGQTELARVLAARIRIQSGSLALLVSRIPVDAEGEFRPEARAGARPLRSTGELLGHLLDASSGFAAALAALRPEARARLEPLRELAGLGAIQPAEFQSGLARIGECLEPVLESLADADLAQRVASALSGEAVTGLELLLGNLEHVASHRQELFLHLRLCGVEVGSAELYGFGSQVGSGQGGREVY